MSNDLTVVGSNGSLTISNDAIVIHRNSNVLTFLNQGLQGDKTIPFRSITAIQFKNAGKALTGYIQFSAHGHIEPKKGLFPHVNDENCVLFVREQQAAFETARAEIDRRMKASISEPTNAISAADELEKLAALLDKGLLTRDEFEDRKKIVLNGSASQNPGSHNKSTPPSSTLSSVRPVFVEAPHHATATKKPSKNGKASWAILGVIVAIGLGALLNNGASNTRDRPEASSAPPYQGSYSNQYTLGQTVTNAPPASNQTPIPQRVARTIQGANLRTSASMDGSVLRQIPANSAVTVLETSGNWLRVSHEGITGWVFKSLIQN